jgi:hypothetical protein
VTRYQTSSLPASPLTSSRLTHHRSARITRVYVSVPLRTLLQSWYRSVVYQVRVVFLLPAELFDSYARAVYNHAFRLTAD